MLVEVLRAKIHRVRITEADLNYKGSISIDESLLEASGIIVGEKVQIVNVNNGERLETYVIKGQRNTGEVCLNGPAARRAVVGDTVIIIAYGQMPLEEARNFEPTIILPDETTNRI